MNRRTLLLSGTALALGGAALLGRRMMMVHGTAGPSMDHAAGVAPTAGAGERILSLPEGAPLHVLTKIANTASKPGLVEARLTAAPAIIEIALGKPTNVLAFNGSLPGPLIEATEGDRVRIEFVNNIPGQISTIHWHGMPVPPGQDGNPMDPVESGSSRVYEFTLPANSAATYWYHPHPHGLTHEQVYRGLAGAFIVRPKTDPLPADLAETVLVISDLRLAADGSMPDSNYLDTMNGREGDHLLVNGQKNPVLTINPGSSRRFRLVNATNARFLRLAFDGHAMTQIGTDGGLLASPLPGLTELLLGPAERAEIVVDFQAKPGTVSLVTVPYERGWMGPGKPVRAIAPLLTVALVGKVRAPVSLPARLRDIAALGAATANKRVVFSETMSMGAGGMKMGYLIDGKKFDMSRVDLSSRAGEVELWEVVNTADMDHPFHMHGAQFQIVERERDGVKTPAAFLSWKDTVNVARGETVRFKVQHVFSGLRMYHCHILEHESQGMMAVLKVV